MKRMTSRTLAVLATASLVVASWPAAATTVADGANSWSNYLDHAYVYSSARPEALRARLDAYGRSVGVTLSDYIVERYGDTRVRFGENEQRRKAIAYLLHYLASGDAEDIRTSVRAIEELEENLERFENRYWYHYIRAHQALHLGDVGDFSDEVFALWVEVIAELETPFATYESLSLESAATSGFVTTLPYLYENVARIILIRSQTLGIDQSLDALSGLVAMLEDGRVGGFPEIIPTAHSSSQYVSHVVERMRGAESDGGGLTFTLALVAAESAHHEASRLLAEEGFSEATIEATRVSMGAYRKALRHAVTLQGQAAVYVRVLREMGEIYAAGQRLGVDPPVELPFGVAEATEVYAAMHRDRGLAWQQHGYQDLAQETYFNALHSLWQEIQEVSLNAAEFELSRIDEAKPEFANERINAALGRYGDYLALFDRFATPAGADAVPDSAYFGAYLAQRGTGAAALRMGGDNPAADQIAVAVGSFTRAIDLYPFDRHLWAGLAATLERTGREAEYLDIVKPTAQKVSRSSYVDRWVRGHEPRALEVEAYRDAVGNDLAIMYFGFADDKSLAELQGELASLHDARGGVEERIASLSGDRETLVAQRSEALRASDPVDASLPAVSGAPPGAETGMISEIDRELRSLGDRRDRLDEQLMGRAKALALYEGALVGDGFLEELASQRDQPVHALVRRLYYEDESESRFGEREFIRSVPRSVRDQSTFRAARPIYERSQP